MIEWPCHGRCTDPVRLGFYGRHKGLTSTGEHVPIEVRMSTQCRKCEACLRKRRNRYVRAAIAETAASQRTWLVTLTLRPEEQYRLECAAQARALQRGWNWSEITDSQRFHHVAVAGFREVQLMLKRLREKTEARCRHLTVVERHTSGLPHWHMLLHECEGTIGKRDISAQWRLGFSDAKLLHETEARAVWYVAKYLSKADARVRASKHYGALNPSLTIASRVSAAAERGV